MPGFLGGSSGSSGAGGEIIFPKEFIDPVTKLRVSQPENLIDTDFEYGLQPTKWETVELINNTPSFFSKSGDTTIPGIISISTNNGTREITVVTATDHGLAVGIPINVTGTKSVTADGSYIINSIPNLTTFTYLCKDEQNGNNAIEDLYSSIITGEFFQGSQIRISDAEGITTDAESISTLTVKTDSTHGFGLATPFYFLNLNSTISQEFEAANTAAKSFDASNSATAQTFDGSNTLSTFNIDFSNSATLAGVASTIDTVDTVNNTITVIHSTETFANQPLGTPLYYSLSSPASSGYFSINQNPYGVVFLKTTNALNIPASRSTFQVSAVPNGPAIVITSSMSGTFQLANQARTFAGNNINTSTQTLLTVLKESDILFDGGNQGFAGAVTNGVCSVEGYSGTILVSTTAGAGLDYYVGAMVRYFASGGSSPADLVSGNTYFIASFASTATPNQFRITLKNLPTDAAIFAPTGGTATTQTFTKIGVSVDRNIVHIRNSNYSVRDMVEYSFPVGSNTRFTAASVGETKLFYFIDVAYDAHNYQLREALSPFAEATGGIVSEVNSRGIRYRVHTFTTVGSSSLVVGNRGPAEYLIVAGGGGGGDGSGGGGGGGGGGVLAGSNTLEVGTYTVVVGGGGARNTVGSNSTAFGLTAIGGGRGAQNDSKPGGAGGSGGGAARDGGGALGGTATSGQGNIGGPSIVPGFSSGGGGGGAGQAGFAAAVDSGQIEGFQAKGGDGLASSINGFYTFYAAGGGGSWHSGNLRSAGGAGGGGQGGGFVNTGGFAGTAGLVNTGSGGGAADTRSANAGAGGSGVVIVRYPLGEATPVTTVATGGVITTTVDRATTYRVHTFTTAGTTAFNVTTAGNLGPAEYLIIGGGGGGEWTGSGGGAGAFVEGSVNLTVQNYSVVVGTGGVGGQFNAGVPIGSGNGANSSFAGVTAIGGGGGSGHGGLDGRSGGSGSGAPIRTVNPAGVGGAGVEGQGFRGGNGFVEVNWLGVSAGGGGAGGYGFDGGTPATSITVGQGGPGRYSTINGSLAFYAGGGAGADVNIFYGASGGIGGGGRSNPDANGSAATANTGAGGGGGGFSGTYWSGAAGGSGIVIIRYPISFATPVATIATGGTTTTTSDKGVTYRVHTFTTVGNSSLVVTTAGNLGPMEYLIVGGGGGGGRRFGGGGGGGGVIQGSIPVTAATFPVVVGGGGTGGQSDQARGSSGSSSSFNAITALGGGAGASETQAALNGGSGGGASYSTTTPGTGTANTGMTVGYSGGVGQGAVRVNGGGGGAAQNGLGNGFRPNGGNGITTLITGTALTFGGGGGGSDCRTDGAGQGAGSQPWGFGGTGGGGAGGGTQGSGTGDSKSATGENGTANTGGGGGGGAYYSGTSANGGNGGSGIVIVRYPIAVAGIN